MVKSKIKPNVLVSRCLGFAACRWNGDIIRAEQVKVLEPFVNFFSICPEADCGLGVPRAPLRLVKLKEEILLFQPASGRSFNLEFREYVRKLVAYRADYEGAIFKSRSPSCGLDRVKLYDYHSENIVGKTSGLFVTYLRPLFAESFFIDEGRLNDSTLRDRFLTAIFVYAEWKMIRSELTPAALIAFHSRNKLLFMAYNQNLLRCAGRLLRDLSGGSFAKVVELYQQLLLKILRSNYRHQSHINVLEHIYGYFKNYLSDAEKKHFHLLLEDYRRRIMPLPALKAVLQSWIERYQLDYLRQQSYFFPYPRQLLAESIKV